MPLTNFTVREVVEVGVLHCVLGLQTGSVGR